MIPTGVIVFLCVFVVSLYGFMGFVFYLIWKSDREE